MCFFVYRSYKSNNLVVVHVVFFVVQPLLREAIEKNANMTEQDARQLIAQCMTVLHYRDARSWNKVWRF